MDRVLILGKGPSAREVDGLSDGPVAALNGAAKLVTRYITWLFVNDVEAFGEIGQRELWRVRHLVTPALMHQGGGARPGVPAHKAIPPGSGIVDHYELHTNPNRDSSLPFFGVVSSVGDTAVAWLLMQGYRDFVTLGIDPDGGYSDHFAGGPQRTDKPLDQYRRNWESMQRRVRGAGGTIERIE